MQLDLDLRLTLDGDPAGNEAQLARVLANLTHLVAPAASANVNFNLQLRSQPTTPARLFPPEALLAPVAELVEAKPTPQIIAVTELVTAPVEPTVIAAPPNDHTTPVATPAAELVGELAEPVEAKPTRLPFAEYDRLVRAEMKSLSRGGMLPGHTYWNSCRTRKLPTLGAVMARYGCKTLDALAEQLGYIAPYQTKADK